ncbi:MAG: flagellar assembly protein A [Termitinemataceae bacterium]
MAGVVIKGILTIEVDAQELEVRLSFAPDKNGQDWSAESVLKLLSEKRFSPLPSGKVLEEVLQRFSKAKGAVAETVIQGVPPEPPIPEKVTWSDVQIPPEVLPLLPSALAKAPPPDLYQVRVEKIKRETVVTKPGPLPFLPPKTEILVTYDKEEFREPISIDPTVIDKLYAIKGSRVGLVAPSKPGKPGRNVYGKPIPPDASVDTQFHLGTGLNRDKNEIIAAKTGVVRIGTNWADVISLASHFWRVERGSDGLSFYLYFDPGDPQLPPPNAADILAAAVSQGARLSDLIPDGEVVSLLERAIKMGQSIAAFPLSLPTDGFARVEITEDKLLATLHLQKALTGGSPLTLKAISEAIRNSGVRGFDAEKVKADILTFMQGPEVELAGYILVQGKAPERGRNKDLKLLVQALPDAERETLIQYFSEDKTRMTLWPSEAGFQPNESTLLAKVQRGVKVAQIVQGAVGTAGLDVFGKEIPPIPGNDPIIRVYQGLNFRNPDIIAETSGVLFAKQDGPIFQALVLEYQDAQVSVLISDDALEARLTLIRESGAGRPLSAELVQKALSDAGVVRGIDGGALAEALKIAMEQGLCEGHLVATGQPAVAAGGTVVRWLVDLKQEGLATGVRKAGVKVGQKLAVLEQQGDEGHAGFTVRGDVIPPEKGSSTKITHDESITEQQEAEGLVWTAAKTGQLIFDGWTAKIQVKYHIARDVGPASGNINFTGDVHIEGSVRSGFAVFAGQNLLIEGSVEAALVSSGGAVRILQGVIGGGKGVVRARKTIEAAFVEQATLLAVEHIRIQHGCLMSNVKTNGRLILVSERGNLVGGLCRARNGVDAANLGSERALHTEVSFGQDYLIMDQIEVAEREMQKVRKALMDLEFKLKRIEGPGPVLDAARAEKVRLIKLMEKYQMHLFTLREKFEEHFDSEIRIRGTVFPGVVLESHGRYYEIKQKRTGVTFTFNRETGRIQEKNLV